MKVLLTCRQRITTQCIFMAFFLSMNSYAAPEANVRKETSSDWKEDNCEFVLRTFETQIKNPIDAIVHYSLAACYSKARDPGHTLFHAVDALTGVPNLEELYANGAKKLVRWAGIELARPKHLNIDPANEITLSEAEVAAAEKKAAEIKILKTRVKSYVDVDLEIVKAKFDPCWDESNLNSNVDCMLTDNHRPPDVP
jgi:hypothetical protein